MECLHKFIVLGYIYFFNKNFCYSWCILSPCYKLKKWFLGGHHNHISSTISKVVLLWVFHTMPIWKRAYKSVNVKESWNVDNKDNFRSFNLRHEVKVHPVQSYNSRQWTKIYSWLPNKTGLLREWVSAFLSAWIKNHDRDHILGLCWILKRLLLSLRYKALPSPGTYYLTATRR